MKNAHNLHKKIGECIDSNKFPNCRIIKAPECGGQHRIPLFCSEKNSNKTKYCNPDILILKDNKIRVIIEIEESDITPVRICGKFLTSALSSCFIHKSSNNVPLKMSDSVTFIQILNALWLKNKSSKLDQGKNLEKSIKNILPVKESKIKKYQLFYGTVSDFEDRNSDKCVELFSYIKEVLK